MTSAPLAVGSLHMGPQAALLCRHEIEEKIRQYEVFINGKLRLDLLKLVEQRAKHQQEIEEFEELLEEVTRLREVRPSAP
jgi:hypothetical protein